MRAQGPVPEHPTKSPDRMLHGSRHRPLNQSQPPSLFSFCQ